MILPLKFTKHFYNISTTLKPSLEVWENGQKVDAGIKPITNPKGSTNKQSLQRTTKDIF